MPLEVSCRLLFLASPGGLTAERERCREVVREYNESRTVLDRVTFHVHAWEDVPGGVGRPQDLINPNLDECDFVILLFGEWWGTPPAHEGEYSSGTEEEFFRALEHLADPDQPMRDILVLFKTVPSERLRDPGESLMKVLHFRARLEASKSLMYESFDSLESLSLVVARKLREWAEPLGPKEARVVEIPEVEVEASGNRQSGKEELLAAARAHAASGMLVQAEAAFARATEDGAAEALLEFAQFMRRTGRLERARELNAQVIDNLAGEPNSGPTAAARVSALANMGVIQRKQGLLSQSTLSLREAVRTAELAPEPVHAEHCYALDNYGFTLLRAGDTERALQQFTLADSLRKEFGTPDEQGQSAINLGRRHLSLDQFAEARDYFESALQTLDGSEDRHLLANAYAGLAEAFTRLEREDQAEENLREALALNDLLMNLDGLSIAHGLFARLRLKQARIEEAEKHISQAVDLVSRTGNPQGRCVTLWLRAELARAKSEPRMAAALLAEAEEVCAEWPDPVLESDIARTKGALQNA